MKTWKEIIEGIKSGEVQEVKAIVVERMRLQDDGDVDASCAYEPEVTFAGLDITECRQKLSAMANNMSVEFGERIALYAISVAVTPELAEEIEGENENILDDLVGRGFDAGEYDNAGTDDWSHMTVDYPYEPLKGSVVAFFRPSSDNLVDLELVADNRTTMICINDDDNSSIHAEVIMTAGEASSMNKEELKKRLLEEVTQWNNGSDYVAELIDNIK